MSIPAETDVLIIGAGPAGLAAATELAPRYRVLVIDREPEGGGIPRHCGHYPFGLREFGRLMKGPDYARSLVARAEAANVRIARRVNAVSLDPGPVATVTSDAGIMQIHAKRILLATGVRESSRAQRLLGGTKPGGIVTTGALQGMVYLEGSRPFRRPVILGTELVSFSAILTCASAGIRPAAMIEPGPGPTARLPLALYPRFKGIPVFYSTRLEAIEGRDRVIAVTTNGPGGRRRIETDGVIVTGRFRSESSLLANGPIERDPRTGGPLIDAMGRCSDPTFYSAGNMLHPVETAGWCWAEGQSVGRAILADLQGRQAAPQQPLSLAGEALSWVVPQSAGKDGAFNRLQLRVSRPARGRLSVLVNGHEVLSRRINTRPERRILLPMPPDEGPATIILEEE